MDDSTPDPRDLPPVGDGGADDQPLVARLAAHPVIVKATTEAEAQLERIRVRALIADAALRVVRDGPTLTPDRDAVAVEAGVEPDVVREHFPTWESLAVVMITRWHDARVIALLPVGKTSGTVAFLRKLIDDDLVDARLVRLLMTTLTASADPGNPASTFYRLQYERFYDTIRRLLIRDVESGREPQTLDPDRGAEQLMALYEGLQLQFLLRDGFDLERAFTRGCVRLRRGWASAYHPEDIEGTFSGVYDV
ncbi:TetR/AcrR family transcriptional regulator [Curtobacterium sp. ISL-83]|uniref:TetR/AcrR family transcriptional regulator n=1 Tax=Curtobacterium sp. ISL-83 TaxID=2819145 RepID=UPI001BE63097|nr:TetR family transcriptional regulator C-terminal domain-containing protein [Curtobacterium sp. ISL-83]MBT2501244.1 TetR family transcriptional regulator C-terminal domain-containing protein [Curtobacterium sp. ISL-83]